MKKNFLKEWISPLFQAFLFAAILFLLCWPVLIDGNSMENTFHTGDRVFMSRILAYTNKLERGDIILCKLEHNNQDNTIIKRLIGLPGDHIIIKSGKLEINGNYISEDYIKDNFTYGNIDIILGKNEYFVLGDNRELSYDSRKAGPIKKGDIIGKVVLKWYPFNEIKIY